MELRKKKLVIASTALAAASLAAGSPSDAQAGEAQKTKAKQVKKKKKKSKTETKSIERIGTKAKRAPSSDPDLSMPAGTAYDVITHQDIA